GGRVTVDAESQLREVVGADGEAVEDLRELLGQEYVAGQLRHHAYLQSVLALYQSGCVHGGDHLAAFVHRAAEGDHQLDVGQPHFVAHHAHRFTLELEAF